MAIKKLFAGAVSNGIDISALREIKILQELHHVNILNLQGVFSHKRNIYLVFDVMEFNLDDLIRRGQLPADVAMAYFKMMLEGLAYLHAGFVVHRDLKPDNCLIGKDGILRISDFGLSRSFGSPGKNFSPDVITLWYRPPEMLFGCQRYSSAVDMWSMGCIMWQLFTNAILFAGETEMDQLCRIVEKLGGVDVSRWEEPVTIPMNYADLGGGIRDDTVTPAWTSTLSPQLVPIFMACLVYDPAGRLSAAAALQAPALVSAPTSSVEALKQYTRSMGMGSEGEGEGNGGNGGNGQEARVSERLKRLLAEEDEMEVSPIKRALFTGLD